MFAKNRQQKIHEIVCDKGSVTTAKLVKEFDVSTETIRRDLLEMEEEGLLMRVHGGAVSKSEMKPFFTLEKRNLEFPNQKKNLSVIAAKYIENGDVIAIDAGSTALIFAQTLKEMFSRLTVVTHSMDVFNALVGYKDFDVILCAGHFLKEEQVFYGSLTLDAMSQLHVQKSFVFPSAVSLEFGICDYQKDMVPIQQQLIKFSDSVFILADSSKYQKNALYKIADTDERYTYISDEDIPESIYKSYMENKIKIHNGGHRDEM